jgi:uncharacterized protein (DUF488 family)
VSSPGIDTIGHSTQPLERFIGLLRQHGITAVADVRSSPYSRVNPQYNREPLKTALRAAGISYVFLGDELGARSKDPSCYRDGKVDYELLARTALFQSGLERVRNGASAHRIALMCAEKEPLDCHRTILVSRKLAEQGVCVTHILADGTVESHDHAMSRLMQVVRVGEHDLFRSPEDALREAYQRRGEEIAYRAESEHRQAAVGD